MTGLLWLFWSCATWAATSACCCCTCHTRQVDTPPLKAQRGRLRGEGDKFVVSEDGLQEVESKARLGLLAGHVNTRRRGMVPYRCCVAGCPGTRVLSACYQCAHAVCHDHRVVGRDENLRWWECPCHGGVRVRLDNGPELKRALANSEARTRGGLASGGCAVGAWLPWRDPPGGICAQPCVHLLGHRRRPCVCARHVANVAGADDLTGMRL